MKKYFIAVGIVAALYVGWGQLDRTQDRPGPSRSGLEAIESAFREQRSGVQITGEGVVAKMLPDDNEGSRHQRFIVELSSGQTLLISHNIDLAPRLASLEPGDLVSFNGVYEWNARGGLIHWTHHDPGGRHPAGWLRHNGRTYQ